MIGLAITVGVVVGFFIVAGIVAFIVLLDGSEIK